MNDFVVIKTIVVKVPAVNPDEAVRAVKMAEKNNDFTGMEIVRSDYDAMLALNK